MPQGTDRSKREHPESHTRRPLPVLSQVTLVGMLGVALAVTANLLIVWLLHGAFVPEFFFVIVPALLVTGLVALRIRWAPMLGAVVALLAAILFLVDPNAQYILSHPGNSFIDFMAEVIVLAFVLLVVVAGVGATTQHYLGGQPPGQRWLSAFLSGLTGIVVGMLVVAALATANSAAYGTSSSTGGEPNVHMTANNFAQNAVLVPKGSRLLIVDDTSVEHILQSGMWTTNGTANELSEPGAPIVRHVDVKGGSAQIGPFTTAGIFHIYCTIHPGMNLTIVVQ